MHVDFLMWHDKLDFAAKTLPDALLGDRGLNQEIPASQLKTSNRRFKTRFAQQFFLSRCSFPSISIRLQKRFSVLARDPLRLAFARNVHSSKRYQMRNPGTRRGLGWRRAQRAALAPGARKNRGVRHPRGVSDVSSWEGDPLRTSSGTGKRGDNG